MKLQPLTALRQELRPQRLLPILTVALISGLVVTTYQISFGSLIFSGDLSAYLSRGIGFCLMGAVLIGGIEALLSSNPGMEPADAELEVDHASCIVGRVDVLVATALNPKIDGLLLETIRSRKAIPIIGESLSEHEDEPVVGVDNFQAGMELGQVRRQLCPTAL